LLCLGGYAKRNERNTESKPNIFFCVHFAFT
jgi:hypothetical protein